ncbi:hypothetical protein BDM02DRAFT_3183218 [Thelephora ganbajun]|uniref:Uncharacterized protein n=1 Tax=Thelephora ganbajun TaxID=370292 RepID=A0ACB6ZU18_THEGA|nr:hypothetical protein BDM02DRAFT_3183218 [Thelephora ganbajun]
MGSGRPALNEVDYKPPWSPQPTQEPPMLQTTARQKKTPDPTRRVSRASVLPDPSRTIKTSASKSTHNQPSSSSEYVHKSPSSRADYPTSYGHDPGDPRPSSSRHPEPKSSKSKTPKSSFNQFTSPVSPNVALAMPYTGWLPPVSKTRDPGPRKTSKSRDKDRDKDTHRGRERDRPSDTHARKASREVSRDPYDSRQQIYHAATLGRDFKERPDEGGLLPKSSGHRRHLTEDDVMTLKSPQQSENNRPTILPTQPPVQPSSVPQYADQSRGLTTPAVTTKYSPPPAPLVAPVWLPQRSKSKEKAKVGQETLTSGSDTERENRGFRTIRGDGSQETLAPSKPKKESKMSLTGWFTRKAPKPIIGSPIMPTPASYLFSPLPETVLPPPHLISLKAGQGPSDLPLSYDSSNKTPGVTGRSLNALETFVKKHNRSQSAQPTISSSRPSANGHDPHGPLRSQTAPVPQTPAIGTYTPSQPGPATYRSHTTPLVGHSQALYPEQNLRSGYGSTQDVRTYSMDTIRGPPPMQVNGHDSNQPLTSYSKDSYSGRNRSRDSVVAGQTGSVSGTIKSKRKPVPLHNIFPDGTVEYATPITNVPASAPIQSHSHDTPVLYLHRSKRDSMAPIPVPPPQSQSAPVNGTFSTPTPVITTTVGILGAELQPISATSSGSHPGLSITDIYPAGYATIGKHDERSGKDQERKERKRRKDKDPPLTHTMDGEHAVLTAKDSPLLATPPVTTMSASSHVPGFLEANGVSSTTASPGMSPNPPWEHQIQDQDPQPISGVGTSTPQHQSLQVPSPGHRYLNNPSSQPSSQRPSPKPSPTGSYLTVPNHSNQPSPTMKNGKHDARIQQDGPDTPSSSSTVMVSTPPINSSRVTLKDSKSTHSYSPARKDDQLYPHSGSHAVGKGSTGTIDTIADPRTYEKGYGKSKLYSYSQEQVMGSGSGSSKEQLVQPPIRSSSDPAASSRSTTQNHPYQSSLSRSTQQQDLYGSGHSLSKPSVYPTERHERKRTSSQDTVECDPKHRDRDRDRERERDRASRRDRGGQHTGPSPSNSSEGPSHRNSPIADNRGVPTTNGRSSSSTHPYPQQSTPAIPTYTYTSQTQQGTIGRSSRNTSQPTGHSRIASDPHNMVQPPSNRVAVSGHLSTPAPAKNQLPPPTPAHESQQLKSASTQTLTTKQSSRPPSTHSTGQDSKKKGGGLLSLFRSISNPSKTRDPPPASAPSQPDQRTGKLRRNSSTAKRPTEPEALKSPGSNTTKVVELPGTAFPSHQQQHSYSTNATYGSYGTQQSRETQNNQDVKGGNAQPRGFHPWKLLSKRHRTMSTASMDALDGTMVSLSTPDESVRSSATSGFYPPLRDPMEAAQEWRNQEEMDFHDRGTGRRRRPGVTFDEPEDKSDLEIPIPVSATHQRPPASRRLSRLR